ncbi:hypothetical protein ABPG74_013628 [Tetrahymena malaccensis]
MTDNQDQTDIYMKSYQEYQQFEYQRPDFYQQKMLINHNQRSNTSFTQQMLVLNNNNSQTTTLSQVILNQNINPAQQNPGISLQLRNSLFNNLHGHINNRNLAIRQQNKFASKKSIKQQTLKRYQKNFNKNQQQNVRIQQY